LINKILINILFVILTLLAISGHKSQAEERINATGTFSNMFYDKDTGDVSGYEVVIEFSGAEYSGTYRFAEGEPTKPVFIKPNIENEMISFSFEFPFKGIYGEQYKGQFVGSFNNKGISGAISNNESRKARKVNLIHQPSKGALPESSK